MRRFFFISFIVLLSLGWYSNSFAQIKPPPILNDPDYDTEKKIRFGFSLGINFMDFQIRSSNKPFEETLLFVDNSRLIPGFNVNVISQYQIVPTLFLRFMPGLAFGQRNITFYNPDGTIFTYYNPGRMDVVDAVLKFESSFIEMPLHVKYSAVRKTNTRPYVIAGTNFRIDMAAYKNLDPNEGALLRLVKGDVYYEFGFGLDYYLTYFKFSTEIKFSAGLLNVFSRDYAEGGEVFAQAIDRLKSQLVVIAFHFE